MRVESLNVEQLRKVNRKILRLESRIEAMKKGNETIKSNGGVLTEHAGWGVGYYQGQLSAYEEWKDSLEEIIKIEGIKATY